MRFNAYLPIRFLSMKILLDKNKKFFKANLHCHSTYSDGKLTVDELKKEYMKKGYSIVAFTDHEHLIDNSRLTDENFLAITACELAIKEFPAQSTLVNHNMRVAHLNVYALDPHNTVTPCYSSVYDHYLNEETRPLIRYENEYERIYSADGINTIIKIAREKGFIVCYNHPSWSLENATHYLQYDGLFAVEIYNHGCANMGIVTDEPVYDDMLRAGKRLFCVASDDNHNLSPLSDPESDSFGGWVYVNADTLEYGNVMSALQKGDFYASTGPQIYSLTRENLEVFVECSPAQSVAVITRGRRAKCIHATDANGVTRATFTLRKTDEYFRLRITDTYGKCAYTQAYYLD